MYSSFAKRRKLSGSLSQLEESTPSEEEEDISPISPLPLPKSRSGSKKTPESRGSTKLEPVITTKKLSRESDEEEEEDEKTPPTPKKKSPSLKGKNSKGKGSEKNPVTNTRGTLSAVWARAESSQKSAKQTIRKK